MKKFLALVLALSLALSLCACGKSEAVKAAEAAIEAIGTVTLESGAAIVEAEGLVEALEADELKKVDNLETLAMARDTYDTLLDEVLNGILDKIEGLTDAMNAMDIGKCIELMDQIEADLAALPADVRDMVIEATATEKGETLVDLFPSFRETLLAVCVHDTYIARPEYVITVANKGGWLVNDHGDFAAYNCWMENESQVTAAYEEYKVYVSGLTEIVDHGDTFTFTDHSGNTLTCLMVSGGVMQVRTPRFEE